MKAGLKGRVREIVASTPAGRDVSAEHHAFLLDLLRHHPDAANKIGCGVAAFFTRENDFGKKALALRRIDGVLVDFSWVKCIDGDSQHKNITAAFRTAIRAQVRQFKQRALTASSTCPLSGVPLTWDNSHVDHHIPFRVLLTSFLDKEKLILNDVQVDQRELIDIELRQRWRSFHEDTAVLRLISATENLKRAR